MNKIIERLDKVKPKGKNRWMAACPAHDDKSPSLAITELRDGRILMKCFAGCEVNDVLTSIGLSMSDLFPDGGLGEYKGFQRLEEEFTQKKAKEKQAKIEQAKTYLQICENARRRGEKLSPQSLELEREAWRRVNE